jgi:hypothetical protein
MRRKTPGLLLRGYPTMLTVHEVQGIVRLSYRATPNLIREHLRPVGAVVMTRGHRYLIYAPDLEAFLLRQRVKPVPVKPRTDSIWMRRGKGRAAPQTDETAES